MNVILVLITMSAFNGYLHAQTSSPLPSETLPNKYAYLPYATPDVSAGAMLGVTPQRIIRPGSVRELVVQLSDMPELGSHLSGVGVECNPFLLMARESPIGSTQGFLDRLSFSLAFRRDSVSQRAAIGLKHTFYDANTITSALSDSGLTAKLYAVNRAALSTASLARAYLKRLEERVNSILNGGSQWDSLADMMLKSLNMRGSESIAEYRSRLNNIDPAAEVTMMLMNYGEVSDTIREQLAAAYEAARSELISQYDSTYEQRLGELVSEARAAYLSTKWAATALAGGMGATFIGTRSAGEQQASVLFESLTAYLTGSYGNGSSMLATLMLEGGLASDLGLATRPARHIAGRFQAMLGTNDVHAMVNANGQYAEYAQSFNDALRRGDGNEGRISFGFEARFSPQFWVYADVGPEWRVGTPKAQWSLSYGIRFAPEIEIPTKSTR